MTNPRVLVTEHLENFHRRLVQDALLEGTAMYWQRRAAAFAAVRTPTCDEVAQSCRNHAAFLHSYGLDQAIQDLTEQHLDTTKGA